MSLHFDPVKALQNACLDLNGVHFQWAQRDEKPRTGVAIPEGANRVEFTQLQPYLKQIPFPPGMQAYAKGEEAPTHSGKFGLFEVSEDGKPITASPTETQEKKDTRIASNAANNASYSSDPNSHAARMARAAHFHSRLG